MWPFIWQWSGSLAWFHSQTFILQDTWATNVSLGSDVPIVCRLWPSCLTEPSNFIFVVVFITSAEIKKNICINIVIFFGWSGKIMSLKTAWVAYRNPISNKKMYNCTIFGYLNVIGELFWIFGAGNVDVSFPISSQLFVLCQFSSPYNLLPLFLSSIVLI